jgi:hypothetical protein
MAYELRRLENVLTAGAIAARERDRLAEDGMKAGEGTEAPVRWVGINGSFQVQVTCGFWARCSVDKETKTRSAETAVAPSFYTKPRAALGSPRGGERCAILFPTCTRTYIGLHVSECSAANVHSFIPSHPTVDGGPPSLPSVPSDMIVKQPWLFISRISPENMQTLDHGLMCPARAQLPDGESRGACGCFVGDGSPKCVVHPAELPLHDAAAHFLMQQQQQQRGQRAGSPGSDLRPSLIGADAAGASPSRQHRPPPARHSLGRPMAEPGSRLPRHRSSPARARRG